MTETDDAPPAVALSEILSTGTLGLSGYRILLDQTGRLMSYRFPTIAADKAWSVEDAAHEFWADKGQVFLDEVNLKGVDADGLIPMLRTFVHRWLIDQVRETDRGSVRHRLEQRMADDVEFMRALIRHYWQLAAPPADAWDGDRVRVLAAMRAVPTGPPPAGGREDVRRPIARPAELVAVLVAMFTAAAGSIHIADITTLVMQRFTHTWTSMTGDNDDAAEVPVPCSTEDDSIALWEAADTYDAADAVIASLEPDDRLAIPMLSDVPALSAHWGLPRAATYRRRAQMYRQIETHCRAYAQPRAVAVVILDAAQRDSSIERNPGESVRLGQAEGHVGSAGGQA